MESRKGSRPWGAPTVVEDFSHARVGLGLITLAGRLPNAGAMPAKIPYGEGHAALRRARSSVSGQIYHVTVVTAGRIPVFLDFDAACAAARCYDDRSYLKESRMLTWVLMPDHAHWLLQLGDNDCLASAVTRLKCASARSANRALGSSGAAWGRAFHEHALRDERKLLAVARYLVANPLRAGLVTRLGDYPFWNSIWL